MDTAPKEQAVVELGELVVQTSSLQIADAQRTALVDTLRPIAERLSQHAVDSASLVVCDVASAQRAAKLREQILEDSKAALTTLDEFDNKLINRLYSLHRGWTALRGRFSSPLEAAAKTLKQKIGAFEQEQQAAAEREQARLQAEADERARKEQERLQKKAAQMRTPEKKEQYQQQAAAVIAPVISVPVVKTGTSFRTVWKVKSYDLTAMGIPAEVQGFVDIKLSNLERAKAANAMLSVKGVQFHQVRV